MSVACIIIAGGKREYLIDERILPSVIGKFDEVFVVGEHHIGQGYTYLPVPALTHSTTDALVKRDVGTLASHADWLFYLCDDHAVVSVGPLPDDLSHIVVPRRTCEGHVLNMGYSDGYCGGHAGLFSHVLVRERPWSTMPHDRLWDLLSSYEYAKLGATLHYDPQWAVEDLEPERVPWL